MDATHFLPAVVAGCLSLFSSAAGARASSPKNPYHLIAERNLFGLTPAPPPQAPAQPSQPLPKVRLTGITTIFGNKRALLKVQFPAQPNHPASEQSYILAEGQRAGPIEVLEVNEKADQVKMDISGTVMEVTFEKSAATKPTAIPAQAPRPFSPWNRPSWSRRTLPLPIGAR